MSSTDANKMVRIAAISASAVCVLAACAAEEISEEADLMAQDATVQALADVSDPNAVKVSNFERFPTKVTWVAEIEGRSYTCDADQNFRVPSCERAAN